MKQENDPLDPDGFEASLTGGSSAAPSTDETTALDSDSFIGVDKNYRYERPAVPGRKPTGTPGSPSSWRQAEGYGFAPLSPLYKNGAEDRELAALSPEDVWSVQQAMAGAGLITAKQRLKPGDPADPVTITAFRKVLAYANHYGSDWQSALVALRSNPPVSLEQLGVDTGDGGRFTGTKKRTDRSVNLTDPKTAEGLANQILKEHLGRKASKGEYQAFLGALNGTQRNSPSVTTSTETYKDGDLTGTSSTTTGGLDAAGVAQVGEDFIDSSPALKREGDRYRAETDLFDAAMSALGSPA